MSGATPLGSQSTALLRRVAINSGGKKIILASFVFVCLFVRMYQGGSHSTDFGEI
jgi:hypothetical protein